MICWISGVHHLNLLVSCYNWPILPSTGEKELQNVLSLTLTGQLFYGGCTLFDISRKYTLAS